MLRLPMACEIEQFLWIMKYLLTVRNRTALVNALSSQNKRMETVEDVQLQLQQMTEKKSENEQDISSWMENLIHLLTWMKLSARKKCLSLARKWFRMKSIVTPRVWGILLFILSFLSQAEVQLTVVLLQVVPSQKSTLSSKQNLDIWRRFTAASCDIEVVDNEECHWRMFRLKTSLICGLIMRTWYICSSSIEWFPSQEKMEHWL